MIKLSVKTVSLLLFIFTSTFTATVTFANSPWSQETDSPVAQQDNEPAVETPATSAAEDSKPAYMQEETPPITETTRVETQTSGDLLNMSNQRATRVLLLDFPRRGMTTDKVQNELGRPNEIEPAVGTPPISRWIYDDRVVFFERDAVIHVVAK